MTTTLQPGAEVFIVTRARTLAGQPPLKGVVHTARAMDGHTFAFAVKVDKRDPQLFPPSEVFGSMRAANAEQNSIVTDARNRAFIAYGKTRERIDRALAAANPMPALQA